MSKRFLILLALAIAATTAHPLTADEGWSVAKLNPFKKTAPADNRARASFSDETPQKLRMPRFSVPKWGSRSQAPQRRDEPSMAAKFSQGTKDFYGKTKSVLMPWTKPKKNSAASSSKQSPKKESFLSSWLPQKEEKRQNKTVKEFLAQPRPGF